MIATRSAGTDPRFGLLIFILATAAAHPAFAAERVLTRDATQELARALAAVDTCRVEGIAVAQAHADVRLCRRDVEQECFGLRLDDPVQGCTGEVAGPWCVHWGKEPIPDELRAALRAALAAVPSVWRQPSLHAESISEVETSGPPPPGMMQPWSLAALLLVLPLVTGLIIGRVLRRWHPWWPALVAGAALMAVTDPLIERVQEIGAWDLLAIALLIAIGLSLGTVRIRRGALAVLIVASSLALAGLEYGVRRWLPPIDPVAAPERLSFLVPPGGWDAGCAVLFDLPQRGVEPRFRKGVEHARSQRLPLVAHLGDSMSYGQGVAEEQTFVALLGAQRSDIVHANYGVPAVGTDFEYLLLQRILAAQSVAMVVLHIYTGNDVFDIDRPYECCDYGPLLDYSAALPEARCAAPRWRFTLRSRLGRSPAPYALRVLTRWSHAARHASVALSQLAFGLDVPPHFISTEGEAREEGWSHFEAILSTMQADLRERGITFVVTLLPNVWSIEQQDPRATPTYQARRRILAITERLGVTTLDTWDLFAAALKRPGTEPCFLPSPDIHLAPEGHRLLAAWLARQLPDVAAKH